MLNRITPALPAHAMKSYRILAPKSTHTRPASCAEVDCAASARGWQTTVDVATPLGQQQANYIRLHSGRSFTHTEAGTLVTFTFRPGQKCFAEHTVSLERDPTYLVRDGDWRGNPRGTPARIHANADDWVDDFGEHQQALADRLGQG